MLKKSLIGIFVLGSLPVLADQSCRFDVWWIHGDDPGAVRSAKIKFENTFTEEGCREESRLGQSSGVIVRITEPGAHIVKTKYTYRSEDSRASGTFKHGVWR